MSDNCGLVLGEKLLFEIGAPGRVGYALPKLDVPVVEFPKKLQRESIGLPEVSEVQVVRHFTRLSTWNYGVDTGLYPLGSCTMKYNPRLHEKVVDNKGMARAHPYAPESLVQGCLQIIWELSQWLAKLSGMDFVTTQPAAGAQGEYTGLKIIQAYHRHHGEERKYVIIPDSAHGTNPASSALCGYEVINIPSGKKGIMEAGDVARVMNEKVAAIMLTNPNTLGLFERNIGEIASIVHQKGGFVYCDGANFNALMGIVNLKKMGIDVIHFNLHKTFTTPHGGGGPGAGPVGVTAKLEPYLPIPVVVKEGEGFKFSYDRPLSIGKIKGFYGNFGILVRAYAYILSMGAEGLKWATEMAVLNANYIRVKLQDIYKLPFNGNTLHECVLNDKLQKEHGVKTIDIAKRLIDYGFHPPTIYFPLVVPGALMIEPTETESRAEMDLFIAAMRAISQECETNPEWVKSAPHNTKISRVDEVKAARDLKLRWLP